MSNSLTPHPVLPLRRTGGFLACTLLVLSVGVGVTGCASPTTKTFREPAAPATSAPPATFSTAPDPLLDMLGDLPAVVVTDDLAKTVGSRELAEAAITESALLAMKETLRPSALNKKRLTDQDIAAVLPFLSPTAQTELRSSLAEAQEGDATAQALLQGLVGYGLSAPGWGIPARESNPITGIGVDRQTVSLTPTNTGVEVTMRLVLNVRGQNLKTGEPEERVVWLDRTYELVPTGGGVTEGRGTQWRVDSWSGSQTVL